MGEAVTIFLAALAAGGQVANVFLHLRIRNAILEQDKALRAESDEKYVHKETFNAQHLELHSRY